MAGVCRAGAGGCFPILLPMFFLFAPPCFWTCMAGGKVGREDEQYALTAFNFLQSVGICGPCSALKKALMPVIYPVIVAAQRNAACLGITTDHDACLHDGAKDATQVES